MASTNFSNSEQIMTASKASEPTPSLLERLREVKITHHQFSRDFEPYQTTTKEHQPPYIQIEAADRIEALERELSAATARAAEAERKLAKCSGKCADLHSEVKGLTDMRDAANGMRDHALKRAEAAELDAGRLVWAMSHMNMPEHHIAFSSHVLSRGGTGDHSDCATYIDAALRWSAP